MISSARTLRLRPFSFAERDEPAVSRIWIGNLGRLQEKPTSEVWGKARAPSSPSETANDTDLAVRCLAGQQPVSNEPNLQAIYLVEVGSTVQTTVVLERPFGVGPPSFPGPGRNQPVIFLAYKPISSYRFTHNCRSPFSKCGPQESKCYMSFPAAPILKWILEFVSEHITDFKVFLEEGRNIQIFLYGPGQFNDL